MLFTRCPECDTTFRVTDEALKKANGQVRCGRCATVFNAFSERVESAAPPQGAPGAGEPAPATPAPHAAESPPRGQAPPAPAAPESAVAQTPPQPETAIEPAAPAETAPPPSPVATAEPEALVIGTPAPPRTHEPADPAMAAIGASSVAEIVAQAELAAAAAAEPVSAPPEDATGDTPAISAERVEEVLGTPADTPLLGAEPAWQPATAPRRRTSRWWSAACAFAVFAFAVQIAHHFRPVLAAHPVFGPWTQSAYALVGITVTPSWDVRQYEILDWVATAEPNTRGVGSLKITARIQNRGPRQQPYPKVQLRLKDRWEKAVGSRTFAPEEYLSHDAPHAALMAVGETARAEIAVVDPGPDAYGFELDVCIEVEAHTLTCRGDKVFR